MTYNNRIMRRLLLTSVSAFVLMQVPAKAEDLTDAELTKTGVSDDAKSTGSQSKVENAADKKSDTLAPVVVTANKKAETENSGTVVNGYQPVASSIATRTSTDLVDVPQSVTIVSDQVLKDQDAQSLDDALANVSGITQANNLGATQDALIRRGFGSNRDGSILINGLKTTLPRSFNIMTDHVEVLKGPGSTLYGILDPGGMINVITKKPKPEFGGEVYGSLSSFGGGDAGFDVGGAVSENGALSFRMLGNYQKTNYWRNFGETEKEQFSPSLRWQGDDTDVTLTYYHEKYSVPFDRGTIFDPDTGKAVNVDPKTRFDEPYNISKGITDMAQIEANHYFDDNWKLAFDYSFSRNQYADNQARVMAYDPTTGNVTRRADATQNATTIEHSARTDLSGDIDVGGFRNEVLFGVSFDNRDTLRTDMIRCSNVTDFNIYSPSYGNLAECTNVSAANSDQTEKLSTASVYSQDSFHLNDQWILVGGLRAQYYDMMAGKGRPFTTNTARNGHELIPNGGIVYKVTPEISLYSNVAKTFRPQSSIGSYVGNIEPEEGISYEVGSKFEMAQGITANIALYTTDKQNVAYTDVVGGETVVKAAGKVRSRGVEIDVAGSLTENLDMIASYGFTDARVVDDPDYKGKRLVNVARHTGSLSLAYDFGDIVPGASDFRAGGGMRAVGKRPGDDENSFYLPGYAVADMFASYKLDADYPVTFQLNLKNIFDKVYYTSSKGDNLAVAIGEPFQAVLSASVPF